MVGARRCRIATMIRTENQAVVLTQVLEQLREPSIELLEAFRVSFDVVAVTPEHIKIDEVAEDEPLRHEIHCPECSVHRFRIVPGRDMLGNSPIVKYGSNLADAYRCKAIFLQQIQQGRMRRRDGKVLSILGALKVPRRPRKGACNHPPYPVLP